METQDRPFPAGVALRRRQASADTHPGDAAPAPGAVFSPWL